MAALILWVEAGGRPSRDPDVVTRRVLERIADLLETPSVIARLGPSAYNEEVRRQGTEGAALNIGAELLYRVIVDVDAGERSTEWVLCNTDRNEPTPSSDEHLELSDAWGGPIAVQLTCPR